ncbi:MAG: DNA-directed DNA polymerase II small subunit [Candidatus Nanohaloarchaea archaeon]
MEQKALKELTKQGCIVGKNAARSLEEKDVEMIKQLDTPPMYISQEMLERLRTNFSPNGHAESTVEHESNGTKLIEKTEGSSDPEDLELEHSDEEDQELQEEFEKKSSHFDNEKTVTIKDTRNHSELDTKVEILDEKDISTDEKDVPEFLQYYNDRYDRMKDLLMRRMEMKSATTINRLESRNKGEEATTIGMVNDKYSTSSGKYIVEIEDKTGQFKVLVEERDGERIVPDEVIGVRGSMGGDIIYADSIVRPDLPIPQGVKTTEEKVSAAYISDLHIGSKDTLNKRMDRFAEWLNSSEAQNIGYLVITGDVVEGVGTYPGQEDELEIKDIYRQYARFEEWVEKIPENIQIIVGPGNHDITRLAEPQPRLSEEALPNVSDFDNVHLVQNPQMVRLHAINSDGIRHLMYHGYSFDDQIDRIKELREKAYEEPHHVMIDLLKRRNLAPAYGSNLLSPEKEDAMVIEEKPDVFVSGHLHSHADESYKGVNVICSSTFQAQTDFQKRVGHEPDPGKVTVMDFKTRNTTVKQF